MKPIHKKTAQIKVNLDTVKKFRALSLNANMTADETLKELIKVFEVYLKYKE